MIRLDRSPAGPASTDRRAGRAGAGDLRRRHQLEQVGAGRKSVAIHLVFQSPERTLTEEEASAVRDAIVGALRERFGAELRA